MNRIITISTFLDWYRPIRNLTSCCLCLLIFHFPGLLYAVEQASLYLFVNNFSLNQRPPTRTRSIRSYHDILIAMNHYNIQYTLQTAAVDVTWFIHVTEARQMRGRACFFQQIHVSWTCWTLGRARNPANPADRITRNVTESGLACWYTTWRHVSIWIVVILKSAIVNTYL